MAFSRRDRFALNPRRIADISAALSHPARVKIVQYLCEHGEMPFSRLVLILPLHPTTVTQHLRILRRHGLIGVSERIPHTFYSVDPTALRHTALILGDFIDEINNAAL